MNLEKINNHLEMHKDDPRLKSIFKGEMTFDRAVKEFYDVEGKGKDFRFREEDPNKIGQRPDELVSLVDGFYPKPLDRSHLEYKEVREGVKNIKPDRSFSKTLATGAISYAAALGIGYLCKSQGWFESEAVSHIYLALGITSPVLGMFGYCFLSPGIKAMDRSKKQILDAFNGEVIKSEDKGHYSLGYINSAALRTRARQVDNLLALGREWSS